MKNIIRLVLASCSISLVLTSCRSDLFQSSVSGKYVCLDPNDKKVIEEVSLDFTSSNKVTVSVVYKHTGDPNIDIPNVPTKVYSYVIEDKKVVIPGVSYGMFGGDNAETFLIQENELIHYSGRFFGGQQCKKK
jgi:hypothetical protein